MTRRNFLGGVLAVSAASYRRIQGANSRIGIALIGAGRQGVTLAQSFQADGRAELRSICDVFDRQRQRARTLLVSGRQTIFDTSRHEDAMAHPTVDAVVIAVPDHLHASLALAALEAKKPVYLEAPVVHRWEEREALQAAVERSGCVLQCGLQQRSGEHYRRVREHFLAPGRLGQVVSVRAVWNDFPALRRHISAARQPAGLDWDRFQGPARRVPYETVRYEAWRYFPDYSGGLLADALTHWADVAQWMMGDAEPVKAWAAGGIYAFADGRVNPDTVNAVVAYKSWNLTFEACVLPVGNGRPSVLFQGTEGWLELARDGYVYQPVNGAMERVAAEGNLENSHVSNFLDGVLDGKSVSAGLKVGLEASRAVHMAH